MVIQGKAQVLAGTLKVQTQLEGSRAARQDQNIHLGTQPRAEVFLEVKKTRYSTDWGVRDAPQNWD